VIGAIFASLIPFTPGCAAPVAEISPCFPPAVYLKPLPEPTLAGPTDKALAEERAIELMAAPRLANSGKEALREWAEACRKTP
jgi:hypothetical protein